MGQVALLLGWSALCGLAADELGHERVGEVFVAAFGIEAAEASIALLESGDAFQQVFAAKIGPEALRHEDFGIGDLPEEVVGDAHLARGADEQVGIGHVAGVEVAGQGGFADGVEAIYAEQVVDTAAAAVSFVEQVLQDAAGGIDDFGAGALLSFMRRTLPTR